MTKEPRANRIPIMFSETELSEIDEWRHANRIATRADAVRRLCKISLFIDAELEEIVDVVSNGVDILSDHSGELSEVFRLIMNRETFEMTFSRDQLLDVFDLAREQADVAEEGLRGIHFSLLNVFNAVAAIVDAKSMKTGVRKFEDIIKKANETVEEADRRKAEREAYSEENRYLAMLSRLRTEEANDEYDRLSDEEQEAFITAEIDALRAEETEDPAKFAERHGIDNRKFWEKPEWAELLEKRLETTQQPEEER